MIARIRSIGANTFREAVRDRVLYNLIVFALLLIGAALVFGQISIGIQRIVLINLGLTAISLFGVVIAVFIGVGLVSKEIEKKTLYTVVSRPVRRWEFIAGKFAGLTGTLAVNTAFMTAGFMAALFLVEQHFAVQDLQILVAIYFILLQLIIVTSVALLFSSFSTPLFSTIFSFAMFIAGTFGSDLRLLASTTHGVVKIMATVAAYVIPNISALNVISTTAHGQPIPGRLILLNTVHAVSYTLVMLAGAVMVFERRNLK